MAPMSEPMKCSYAGCAETAWSEDPQGLCLCHSPGNGKSEETAQAVWTRARSKAEARDPSFRGWHFPSDPGGTGVLLVSGDSDSDRIRLDGATFEGQVWLRVASGSLVCRAATFMKKAFFGGHGIGVAEFQRARFLGPAVFSATTFREGATFDEAAFSSDAYFGEAEFQDYASFEGAIFKGKAAFAGATFRKWASWQGARFEAEAQFNLAAFEGNANFARARFDQAVHFSGASVHQGKHIAFDLPRGESPLWGFLPLLRRPAPTPFRQREEGETAYRLAKDTAQSSGDYRRAGQYHFAEQCAIEHSNRKQHGWRFWHWLPELAFARWVFGYGERPLRPLAAALVLIAVSAVLAFALAGITPDPQRMLDYRPTLGECVYFSFVTFTTVGYGDLNPKPHFRLFAAAEAFAGFALMAVLIVTMTRKYTR